MSAPNFPIVGILAHSEWVRDGTFYSVRQSYASVVLEHRGLPILAPPYPAAVAIDNFLDVIDGLLVPGGVDVSPHLYGEEPHEALGKVDPELDYAESQMIRGAWDRDLPILAICRGIQALAITLGGSLYQDLPSQFDGGRHEVTENGRDFLAHELRLKADSKLVSVLQRDQLRVNSLHHQGIRNLPGQLEPVGWSEDGLIEAAEGKGKAFVVALQCHPEELWQADAAFASLFQAFIAAAGSYADR